MEIYSKLSYDKECFPAVQLACLSGLAAVVLEAVILASRRIDAR